MSCMCQYNSRVTGGEGSRMEIEERKDLYHGISSSRKETFSFNERSGRVFFLPSLSAVAVRQQLQCKNQVSQMKTRTRATALIQKKKEECPVTLRTHQEK